MPLFFLDGLAHIDPKLKVVWHNFWEVYFIIRQVGPEKQDVLCSLDYEHLNGTTLVELRQAYAERALSSKERAKRRKARSDAEKADVHRVQGEAFEAIATQQAEAACTGGKVHAEGAPGEATPPVLGNRLDGMVRRVE